MKPLWLILIRNGSIIVDERLSIWVYKEPIKKSECRDVCNVVDFNHKMDERSTGLDDLEVFFEITKLSTRLPPFCQAHFYLSLSCTEKKLWMPLPICRAYVAPGT